MTILVPTIFINSCITDHVRTCLMDLHLSDPTRKNPQKTGQNGKQESIFKTVVKQFKVFYFDDLMT